MDIEMLAALAKLQNEGQTAVLVTIVATRGSTPQKAGAQMLVYQDGKITGTIGGGCSEAQVRQQALLAIDEGRSYLYSVNLLDDIAAEAGMVCGGVMDVLLQVID